MLHGGSFAAKANVKDLSSAQYRSQCRARCFLKSCLQELSLACSAARMLDIGRGTGGGVHDARVAFGRTFRNTPHYS